MHLNNMWRLSAIDVSWDLDALTKVKGKWVWPVNAQDVIAAEPLPAPDAMKVEQKYRSRSSPQIARAATDMANRVSEMRRKRQCIGIEKLRL
jgi:hypothetical protein